MKNLILPTIKAADARIEREALTLLCSVYLWIILLAVMAVAVQS